jgi:hypothetical protein
MGQEIISRMGLVDFAALDMHCATIAANKRCTRRLEWYTLDISGNIFFTQTKRCSL